MDLKYGPEGKVGVTFDSFSEQVLVGPFFWHHMSLGGRLKYAAGILLDRSMEYTVPLSEAWDIQDQLDARSSALKDKLATQGGSSTDTWVVTDAAGTLKRFLGDHHRPLNK